jgi:hypothetical protein
MKKAADARSDSRDALAGKEDQAKVQTLEFV